MAEISPGNLVTEDEMSRVANARSKARKESFVLGRGVLRLLLSRVLDRDPMDFKIGIHDDGSLYLPDYSGHISLSHTADSAAAVYSTRPVGIDIEEIKQRRDDLYTYVLHPDEYHLIEDFGKDPNESTILFWTLKEAVLKGRRSGLRHSPRKIRLEMDFDASWGVALAEDGDKWTLSYSFVNEMYQSIAFQ